MVGHVVTARTEISASPAQVWAALTDPEQIRTYMFGTQVETDWQPGSPITWRGEYEGKEYVDTGTVVEVEPHRRLTVTHFSPLSGLEDDPQNYHTVTYELVEEGTRTRVLLSQDNNPTEEAAEHSRQNWEMALSGLKEIVERG